MGMADVFGLFVSSVQGQPVSRFGTAGAGSGGVLIGATRNPAEPRKIIYDPAVVVGIPHAEALKYAREYQRAVSDGSLTLRTAAAWTEQQNQSREVGAPREKLKTAEPAQTAKEADHVHPEGGRERR
jgi:hypothetical protein